MEKIRVDTLYQVLSENARDQKAGINANFRLFIQLYSAIVGGTIVLANQHAVSAPQASLAQAATLLVVVVALGALGLILDNYRSWRGFRKHLTKIAGADVAPSPRRPSYVSIGIMTAIIIFATVLFYLFNPLY